MLISTKLLVLATVLILSTLQLRVTRYVANAESASDQTDEKDCADQMQQMASCIPYVSGTAAKPTPQCCADTETVRSTKPKCLCLLIKESTDPSLGLPINTTLALHMPDACHSDAKVSNCPSLLKLAPNSPEAKIFEDASGGGASANSSTSSPTGQSSSDSVPKVPSTNGCIRTDVISKVGFPSLMIFSLMLLV
ncbi:Bifunctional inhibitor/lipid-transfer protein/seed storage 2S albumin superfamily protein [Rhynchospora pubera]|uniref:Bifunctional inhibitor/lipid-transfer protein/seed storage 2S albumin superfamily protein n=1 Tax=Rhynchospora pubera TaxID=906938 RepID=A0AAV8HPT9_9POAL|nr:Bifunctional inhibitor/lipid-transfer protein/seed storage 2S albumin superfamily protein [Rhynchospora pubera]KAJ4818620.1 Bifunctional inhibitor/lipid-transfer protein/seed storage 2S albumin superfamily protein [Rhynchospora pubera]